MMNDTARDDGPREDATPDRPAPLLRAISKWGAASVFLLTALVFLPSLFNQFVSWDDGQFVVFNPFLRGWTAKNLAWMWTTSYMGTYMPLTWMSWALDQLLWGMNPAGYHLTNVLLHASSAAVFYSVVSLLLGRRFRNDALGEEVIACLSALAALLFSLHPLRVESVAWVTERKDVLSGLFFLLTVRSYLGYALSGGERRIAPYVHALVFFLLSLLAKPAGMALPVALLLLDHYPLGRFGPGAPEETRAPIRQVLHEKIPFAVLAVFAAQFAYHTQSIGGAIVPFVKHGLIARAATAAYGAMFYIVKTVVPLGLSPLIQMSPSFDPFRPVFLCSGAAVVLVSGAAYLARKRYPSLPVAWTMYLVILAPVSGLVTFGSQLVADRYSYLCCLVWPALGAGVLCHLWRRGTGRRAVLWWALAGLVGADLSGLTFRQIRVWRSPEALWTYAVAHEPQSPIAHNNLGNVYMRQGRRDAGLEQYQTAFRLDPDYPDACNNIGNNLTLRGEFDKALWFYRRALRLDPKRIEFLRNLELLLTAQAERLKARGDRATPPRPDPDWAAAYVEAGRRHFDAKDYPKAFLYLLAAVRYDPASAQAHQYLGDIYAMSGQAREAALEFEAALRHGADRPEVHYNLGLMYLNLNALDAAVPHFRKAAHRPEADAKDHNALGAVLARLGRTAEAAQEFNAAVQADPTDQEALDNLASLARGTPDGARQRPGAGAGR